MASWSFHNRIGANRLPGRKPQGVDNVFGDDMNAHNRPSITQTGAGFIF